MQPSYPYRLKNCVGVGSTFCIPVFVRCKEVTSLKVKLSFEFIAKSIMKSSLTEDFSIDFKVKAPFSVQYCLSNDEIFCDEIGSNNKEAEEVKAQQLINSDIYRFNEADEISSSSINSVLFKLKCSNDLCDSIVVDSIHCTTLNNLNENLPLKIDPESVNNSSFCRSILRLDEELLLSRYVSTQLGLNRNQENSLLKFGTWNILWNLSSSHPLKFSSPAFSFSSLDKFSPFSSDSFNWLISPFLTMSDIEKQFANYVKLPQSGSSLAKSSFPLPELTVSFLFFPLFSFFIFFVLFADELSSIKSRAVCAVRCNSGERVFPNYFISQSQSHC
jgi:hypothetical protein